MSERTERREDREREERRELVLVIEAAELGSYGIKKKFQGRT